MAAIKQRTSFINRPIGLNRFKSNDQQPWEALSRAAGNLAETAMKDLYSKAEERGEDIASKKLLVMDENNKPSFLEPPSNLSPVASEAYQNVIDKRYEFKIQNDLQTKIMEYKQKHFNNAELFDESFSKYATTLASNSGGKWAAYINDISQPMLAQNKLQIISNENKSRRENLITDSKQDFESIIKTIGDTSEAGLAISNAEELADLRGVNPLSVTLYNQLEDYTNNAVSSNLITEDEQEKYLLEAKTNMALGSINLLLNNTTSKIQRDIVQGFVLSGDTSGFNLLPDGMADNLMELKEYVDSSKGGNLGPLSTRITQVRGPLDDKEAFVIAENKKIRQEALRKATLRNELNTKIATARRELVLEQQKVFANSLKISGAAQKKRLEELEKNRKAAVKEAATKFYLRGGLTAGVFNEVFLLKQTLNNDEAVLYSDNINVYYESLSDGISNIFNKHTEQIDEFASENVNAITKDERKEAYKKVKTNLATSILNLFGGEIRLSPAELERFGDVLLDVEVPSNEPQLYAKQIINRIFNNDPTDIKKFIKDFQPSSRQVMLEKERTFSAWNNLVEFATNANPNNANQNREVEKRIKEFNSQPSSSYITATQREEAEEAIKLYQTKKIAAESIQNLSSNDVNNLELLNASQNINNFDLNDPNNKRLVEVSALLKGSGVDISKINVYLSSIKSDKNTNETEALETKKKTELRSALMSGTKDLNYSDADHVKEVDKYVAEVGLDNFVKGINESSDLNNIINTFGSNIIMDTFKDIAAGNTVGKTDELITNFMINYASNSKIRRDEKTPLINNYVAQGFLTENEANKLDLMLLLKQQAGMEERSFANISSLIDSSTAEQNLTIEYGDDGSQQKRLKKVTSRQLLLLSMGASSRQLRAKPTGQVINPSQSEKNFIQKYDPVVKAYMEAGLSADAITNHFSKKFKDEYEIQSEFVFEDNGINNLDNIRKNHKFKTQYPIGKYLQTEDETNWWTEKVETNLNTQGFTLYENNKQYERVVLKPYIKTDSPVQVYNPYRLTDNNVLEPALYNLTTGNITDPEDLFETKSEISIPHFPTNFKELYDYRAEVKQKIRDDMSNEILSGVGTNQKMGIGLQLYKGFVFGTTATSYSENVKENLKKSMTGEKIGEKTWQKILGNK